MVDNLCRTFLNSLPFIQLNSFPFIQQDMDQSNASNELPISHLYWGNESDISDDSGTACDLS